MKFKLLTAVIMLAAWSLATAGDGPMVGTPRGGPQALATADYGGVFYSTSAFPVSGAGVHYSTVAIPQVGESNVSGVFYGVMFSSGNAGAYDFVDVYDSTSSDRAKAEGPIVRLYNVNGSTNTSFANGANASGFSGPPKPMRFFKGLILRANTAAYNMITTLFYKEP